MKRSKSLYKLGAYTLDLNIRLWTLGQQKYKLKVCLLTNNLFRYSNTKQCIFAFIFLLQLFLFPKLKMQLCTIYINAKPSYFISVELNSYEVVYFIAIRYT